MSVEGTGPGSCSPHPTHSSRQQVVAGRHHALVTPVYKKGNKHSPSNYHPVSPTAGSCKLLEHIVCYHVFSHLAENNMLITLQNGFQWGQNCENQPLLTYNDLIRSFDKSLQSNMSILDFLRAFDSVPHSKLISYIVNEQVFTWIDWFLSDHNMTMVVDGHTAKGVFRNSPGSPALCCLHKHRLHRHCNPSVRRCLFIVSTHEEEQKGWWPESVAVVLWHIRSLGHQIGYVLQPPRDRSCMRACG